jgi:hypothetical protein
MARFPCSWAAASVTWTPSSLHRLGDDT